MWAAPKQPTPPSPMPESAIRYRFIREVIMAGARSGAIFDDEPADIVNWAVKLYEEMNKI